MNNLELIGYDSETFEQLQVNIAQLVREIEHNVSENVIDNYGKRMIACQKSRGVGCCQI